MSEQIINARESHNCGGNGRQKNGRENRQRKKIPGKSKYLSYTKFAIANI